MSSNTGLRVEAHIRGHVASCNGRVELVRARAEHHSLSVDQSPVDPLELQARAEQRRRQKEERLLAFQRDVKERVRRKELARQKQLSETVHSHPQKEKRPTISASVGEKVWSTLCVSCKLHLSCIL